MGKGNEPHGHIATASLSLQSLINPMFEKCTCTDVLRVEINRSRSPKKTVDTYRRHAIQELSTAPSSAYQLHQAGQKGGEYESWLQYTDSVAAASVTSGFGLLQAHSKPRPINTASSFPPSTLPPRSLLSLPVSPPVSLPLRLTPIKPPQQFSLPPCT